MYNYVKLWGLPNNAGWANEDAVMIQAITAIESEAKDIEYELMHKNDTQNNNSISSLRKGAIYG